MKHYIKAEALKRAQEFGLECEVATAMEQGLSPDEALEEWDLYPFDDFKPTEEQLKRVPSPDFWEMQERAKRFQASLPPYSLEDAVREMKARGQYRTSIWTR